jgi:CHASE2 domain-containing sensor protein
MIHDRGLQMKWHRLASHRYVVGPAISLAVGLLVVGIRWLGGLQALELKAYDLALSLQPMDRDEGMQVILIARDDRDVASANAAYLSDHRLAQLLSRLRKAGAAAIGVHLLRDVPMPDANTPGDQGRKELCDVISEDDRIIVGMAPAGSGANDIAIQAPCGLTPDSGQVGSFDLLVDNDHMVRRALVYGNNGDTAFLSFALRLAQVQLRAEGIKLQPTPDGLGLILGKSDLARLTPNEGAYRNLDARGWQIRLDYKSSTIFQLHQFSMTDVNSGRLRNDDVKGKVVLIGSASRIDNDFFNTPVRQHVLGITMEAMIADQLVRMARYGASAPRAGSKFTESLWIIAIALLGGIVSLLGLRPLRLGICLVAGVLVVILGAYALFCAGWWFPVVPAAFSWFAATVLVAFYGMSNRLNARNSATRVIAEHADPAAGPAAH